MLFSQNFLDELRNRVSVAEIVGRVVKLTRKGREFSGLCPFHGEKTPSFTVSEEKGFYHCFGCGAHGDVIKFLMQHQNLSFADAVTQLAEQAGLEIPQATQNPRSQQEQSRRQELLRVMAFANQWYILQLQDEKTGMAARQYLEKRGLSAATIQKFGIGFAPDSRDALRAAILKNGFAEDVAIEAGLIIKSDDRANYDRFRGRVMFPITNVKGSAIAFGGRILDAGEPKYLNSPETPLFHKGHVVYALPHAMAAMGRERSVVVVEGYMDAVALHQAGIENAVANLGTALTEQHLQLLWRYCDKILLCFDGDAAGVRAASRSIERILPLLRTGKEVRFITIPSGFDPDSFVQAHGKRAFMDLCAKATPFHEKLLDIEFSARPVDTPEGRTDFYARLKSRLSQIKDQILRNEYRLSLHERTKTLLARPSASAAKSFAAPYGKKQFGKFKPPAPRIVQEQDDPQSVVRNESMALLAACILYPKLLLGYVEDLGTITFADDDLERMRHALMELAQFEAVRDEPDCTGHLPENIRPMAMQYVEQSRRTYYWLRHDNSELLEKWQQLLFAIRYNQDHVNQPVVLDALLDEQGWAEFVARSQSQTDTQSDVENSLLGFAAKK